MSKKSNETKQIKVTGLSNLGVQAPFGITSIEKDFKPHSLSEADLIEVEKKHKSKSLLKRIKESLLGEWDNPEQSVKSKSKTETVLSEPETISCHVCGNLCKGNDYYCPECGSKLKAGRFDNKK